MYAIHVAIMFTRVYLYCVPVLRTCTQYRYARVNIVLAFGVQYPFGKFLLVARQRTSLEPIISSVSTEPRTDLPTCQISSKSLTHSTTTFGCPHCCPYRYPRVIV